VASSGLGHSEDSRRRESSPPGQTLNEARKHALAISRTGLVATRVHGADGPERLHTSVELLAADMLLKLPGGPWWSIRDRLNKHLQAAMSSERIGAQHCISAAVLQQLKMLGIVVSHDDLVGAARHLHAWHRGKGILISAFVDGLVSVAKIMGTEPPTVSMEWTLPMEKVESWAQESGPAAQDEEWPSAHCVERADSNVNKIITSISANHLTKVSNSSRKFEDPACEHAKDWRMSDRYLSLTSVSDW